MMGGGPEARQLDIGGLGDGPRVGCSDGLTDMPALARDRVLGGLDDEAPGAVLEPLVTAHGGGP